ncbi:MAG TPA: VOC family protein [Vicinamibacterales bacterium]|nr:VOC family protein [Vicinamibacterales bacterium]
MPLDRPSHRGLRHLALNVRDMDAMKRFYRDLLGFEIEWEPDPDNVYLSSGLDNLALHRATSLTEGPEALTPDAGKSSAQTLDHLGVIVRELGDVDTWAAFLEERGVVLAAHPKTHRDGARSLYFKDPDGNAVQIIYHPPISGKD